MSAGPSNSASAMLLNVAEAAEEFVDQMNPSEDAVEDAEAQESSEAQGEDNSLEGRRKKLEQLRKRMVSKHDRACLRELFTRSNCVEVFSASQPRICHRGDHKSKGHS